MGLDFIILRILNLGKIEINNQSLDQNLIRNIS